MRYYEIYEMDGDLGCCSGFYAGQNEQEVLEEFKSDFEMIDFKRAIINVREVTYEELEERRWL